MSWRPPTPSHDFEQCPHELSVVMGFVSGEQVEHCFQCDANFLRDKEPGIKPGWRGMPPWKRNPMPGELFTLKRGQWVPVKT